MKLLLTGRPKSGKTTLLENFIEAVPNKQGFVTQEVLENSQRIGFELVSSTGKAATLASTNSDSELKVSKYGVELHLLDEFLSELPPIENGSLVYVDEIGQMELYSDSFKRLISSYLDMDNVYVGTISSVYQDDFTQQVLARGDVLLLKIDQNNREQVQAILKGLASNLTLYQHLNSSVQSRIIQLARNYSENNQLSSLKKLFNNAIKYVAENRITTTTPSSYLVKGDTRDHIVETKDNDYKCDCDLFSGKGSFEGNPAECSHIQSVKILSNQ